MKKMFALLADRSMSPVEDQMKLWDIIVFHWLIGNTDGHIKNFSLLYDSRLRSLRLAPAYDIISTVVYDNHSSQMAFSIGGESDWGSIGREHFERAADEAGLNRKIMLARLDSMSGRFDDALRQASTELAGAGYTEVTAIADLIRQAR